MHRDMWKACCWFIQLSFYSSCSSTNQRRTRVGRPCRWAESGENSGCSCRRVEGWELTCLCMEFMVPPVFCMHLEFVICSSLWSGFFQRELGLRVLQKKAQKTRLQSTLSHALKLNTSDLSPVQVNVSRVPRTGGNLQTPTRSP